MNGDFDVIVCGGGPAGIGAAVAAGRAGARTLLVEQTSCLGGLMGNAFVGSCCDSPGGPVFDELVGRLLELDAAEWRIDPVRFRPPGRLSYHPETVRAVANEMVLESGIEPLFCTFVESALVHDGQVSGVIAATKSGAVPLKAKVVIDCTADGDIAASAGALFNQGDPTDGRIQVCNFRWHIGGVDAEAFVQANVPADELKSRFERANRDGDIQPPGALFAQDVESFPFDGRTQQLILCNWELQGVDPTDARQVSCALSECQRAALQIVRFCRRELPGYANCRIAHFPTVLGTRESRRITGHYSLTRDDVLRGRKFVDGIAKAWFWIDFHDPPPGCTIPHGLDYVKAHQPPPAEWYEIPYRCLIPAEIDNLLVAGRCISCDRAALASMRVMPTCMFIGAAAGLAASQSIHERCPPSKLDGAWLKTRMIDRCGHDASY